MVCRLFLTRWWTSRMAASLDSSRRSRRRRSLTSRMSTSAPVTAPLSSSGMQRNTTAMSLPSPISSVDGQPGLVGQRHRRLVEAGLVEANSLDARSRRPCGGGR